MEHVGLKNMEVFFVSFFFVFSLFFDLIFSFTFTFSLGTPPEGGFDGFMNLTFWDELGRAAGGWLSACFLSANSALPPILRWGSESMKRKGL